MKLPLALIQTKSTTSIAKNLLEIEPMIMEAIEAGAKLISLPEVVNLAQLKRNLAIEEAQYEKDDPFLSRCQALAKAHNIWLHLGSLVIKLEDDDRMVNRAFMINGDGEIVARYDKIHMFDVDLTGGESYRESKSFQAGEEAVLVETPWGKVGLTICYDVRFPQLHRCLAEAGAKLILNPASFTQKTGEAHWHTLLTARAIETTCFIAAAAQGGIHDDGRHSYGHSLVVDPWGRILVDAGKELGATCLDLDMDEVEKTRQMIPSLQNGRDFTLKIY